MYSPKADHDTYLQRIHQIGEFPPACCTVPQWINIHSGVKSRLWLVAS